MIDKYINQTDETEHSRAITLLRSMIFYPERASYNNIDLLLNNLQELQYTDSFAYKNLLIMHEKDVNVIDKRKLHRNNIGLFRSMDPCYTLNTFCTVSDILWEVYFDIKDRDKHK